LRLTQNENLINYVRRFDNIIYQFHGGEIAKEYVVDFKKYSVPDNLKKENDEMKVLDYCRENNRIFAMSNVVDNGQRIMFFTERAVFFYDKNSNILNGYKQIINSRFEKLSMAYYLPLNNTAQIAYILEPSEYYESQHESTPNVKIDDNPIILIYDVK